MQSMEENIPHTSGGPRKTIVFMFFPRTSESPRKTIVFMFLRLRVNAAERKACILKISIKNSF